MQSIEKSSLKAAFSFRCFYRVSAAAKNPASSHNNFSPFGRMS